MIRARHPDIAAQIVGVLEAGGAESPILHAASTCARQLGAAGAQIPTWNALAEGARPQPIEEEHRESGVFQHGWQFMAAWALDN